MHHVPVTFAWQTMKCSLAVYFPPGKKKCINLKFLFTLLMPVVVWFQHDNVLVSSFSVSEIAFIVRSHDALAHRVRRHNKHWNQPPHHYHRIEQQQRFQSSTAENEIRIDKNQTKKDNSESIVTSSASTTSSKWFRSASQQRQQQGSRFVATTNPIDLILKWIASDMGSIILGLTGLIILLANGIFVPSGDSIPDIEAIGQETRNNLLAVFAFLSILLNGVTLIDVESLLAEPVTLQGMSVDEVICITQHEHDGLDWNKVPWVLRSILEATPAKTAVLIQYQSKNSTNLHDPIKLSVGSWEVRAVSGVVSTKLASSIVSRTAMIGDQMSQEEGKTLSLAAAGSNIFPSNTPILNRFLQTRDNPTDHFPTLQALPGSVEFTSSSILPSNTQSALIIPIISTTDYDFDNENNSIDEDEHAIRDRNYRERYDINSKTSSQTLLVLGSDLARSFTPRDIAWCQAVSKRIMMMS